MSELSGRGLKTFKKSFQPKFSDWLLGVKGDQRKTSRSVRSRLDPPSTAGNKRIPATSVTRSRYTLALDRNARPMSSIAPIATNESANYRRSKSRAKSTTRSEPTGFTLNTSAEAFVPRLAARMAGASSSTESAKAEI